MNIHEYQAKELLRGYGVAVLEGHVAWTPDEAVAAAGKLPGPVYVVKSQIHAGGRGAGHFADDPNGKGGVRIAKSADDVRAAAEAMIGHTLITKQTGAAGRRVNRVYVEAGCDIKRELYLSLLVDRATSRVTVMASTEGGMEIEEVASHQPEKIFRVAVDPATGISGFHARRLAFGLGLTGKQVGAFTKFVSAMYQAFTTLDCAIVEINPLVVTGAGDVVALDAKVSFDDNALFRHPELEKLHDEAEEDPKELEAAKHSLNYVALDGTIGCMVNGAGLAMATMDIIKLYGASPALVTTSGLISTIAQSSSMKASYIASTNLVKAPTCLPERPRPKARPRAWKAEMPVAGSTETRRIFSGLCSATSSISIPPSVEAMIATRDVARSTSRER